MIRHIGIDKQPRENIGEAVARMMNELAKADYEFKLLAIVPRMQQLYATSPKRYETTGVDLIIEDGNTAGPSPRKPHPRNRKG